MSPLARKKTNASEQYVKRSITFQKAALIAAEEFSLSMVPLLSVVNEVGGVAKAISILREYQKTGGGK